MPVKQKECECGQLFLTVRRDVNRCPRCRRIAKLRENHQRRTLLEKMAPGRHSLAEWFAQIEAQRNLCYWCHASLLSDSGNFCGEKDHLIPLSRGGSQNIGNIVAACSFCNQQKHKRTWREYQQFLLSNAKHYASLSCTISSLPPSKNLPRFDSYENLVIAICAQAGRRRMSPIELDVVSRRLYLRAQIDRIVKSQTREKRSGKKSVRTESGNGSGPDRAEGDRAGVMGVASSLYRGVA